MVLVPWAWVVCMVFGSCLSRYWACGCWVFLLRFCLRVVVGSFVVGPGVEVFSFVLLCGAGCVLKLYVYLVDSMLN